MFHSSKGAAPGWWVARDERHDRRLAVSVRAGNNRLDAVASICDQKMAGTITVKLFLKTTACKPS